MSSRLGQDIKDRSNGAIERELEVMVFDDALSLKGVDPYVGYEMTWAFENYILGIYGASVLFCGLAFEEQLGLVYETKTGKDASKENLASLIDWARTSGVVDPSWGDDAAALDEIRDVRNYFAHSNRVIAPKTRKKAATGTFKLLLASKGVSHLGDLDTQECASNTLRFTASILNRLM
jgi:hypothetical protein